MQVSSYGCDRPGRCAGTSQWGVGESRVAARGRRQGRSRGVHPPGPMGPGVHMWAGRPPANAGPSTCGHGAPGPPPFWRAPRCGGVLTLVVVTGEAVNRYLKEELLWLISTLTP